MQTISTTWYTQQTRLERPNRCDFTTRHCLLFQSHLLGRFCKKHPVRFSERSASSFGGGGSKYTRTCANRKFVLQTENWFSVSISVRPVPTAKRSGDVREDFGWKWNHVALQSQSDKVALARKNVYFTLACFARQCGAELIINELGSSRTVSHEGE